MDNTDIIEIKIPSEILNDAQQVCNVSETLRLQIQKNIEEKTIANEIDPSLIKQTKQTKQTGFDSVDFNMIYEILSDRMDSEILTSIDELCALAQISTSQKSVFIASLNKFMRDKSMKLHKTTRNKQSYYLLKQID